MKEYLIGIWNKFKNTSLVKKILSILLIVLYIFIICICVIKVEVDLTTPGSITNVSNVIDIDSEYQKGNIYTVSVFSKNKVSVLHYLISKIDSNSDVKKGKSIASNIFTDNEEYMSNVGYKEQSIQDSIIIAYESAIKNNYDVKIDYSYQGQQLINIPQNLFKTGAEDFKNGDIIINYNDNQFESSDDFINTLDNIFKNILINNESIYNLKVNGKFKLYDDNGNKIKENINLIFTIYEQLNEFKETFKFKVIRNENEKEINSCLKMLFYLYTNYVVKEDKVYSINGNQFTKYKINYNNCSPKININESNTVGPSGGLLQTLAVYNSIVEEDITKGLRIMGTGGINLKGEATSIGAEQQKIVTANFYSADIFFIPEENFESAKIMYDTIKEPTFSLVSVKNFNDVLTYLNNMEVSNG